jgi:N utilization substance protein A
MSKELLLIVDSVAHEKDIPRQAIFEALEAALAGVSRKQLGGEALVRVAVNTHDGAISAFRQWQVVADDERMENPLEQVRLMDARDDNYDVEVGDILEEAIDPPQLTRVAAQTANQILVQRVREGERERVRGEWADRVGEMVTGAVKRIDRGALIIDINGAEAGLARSAQIPGERLKIGARVRVMVTAINLEARGAPLVVSRTDPRLLSELFAVEVPEVREGLVEIKAVARDPGARSKIAVVSHDRRTDPIGACIGMRGARVQAIANELGGERVDIVLWSDEPAQMVINAIAPGQIEKIVLIEDERRMELAVADGGLGIALGRGGQNVRLASALCGWQLRVMSVEEFDAKAEDEITQIKQLVLPHWKK